MLIWRELQKFKLSRVIVRVSRKAYVRLANYYGLDQGTEN